MVARTVATTDLTVPGVAVIVRAAIIDSTSVAVRPANLGQKVAAVVAVLRQVMTVDREDRANSFGHRP